MLPMLFGGRSRGREILQSAIFDSADSNRLTRTALSAGDSYKGGISVWIKRSKLDSSGLIIPYMTYADSSNYAYVAFSSDKFYLRGVGSGVEKFQFTSTALTRDVSEYYHLLWFWETNNVTSTDRVGLYVNGTRVTDFDSFSAAASDVIAFNYAGSRAVGGHATSAANLLDAVVSDMILIDGTVPAVNDFGEFDQYGRWIPKDYTGSYGTNGFHLDFADNTHFGNDVSGNANDFTDSGFTTDHQVTDTPTNNHATFNPLWHKDNGTVYTHGARIASTPISGDAMVPLSMLIPESGKWYAEFEVLDTKNTGGGSVLGIIPYNDTNLTVGIDADSYGYADNSAYPGYKRNNGSYTAYGTAFTINDKVGIAFDADTGSLYFYLNGTIQNSGTAAFTGISNGPYLFACSEQMGSDPGKYRYVHDATPPSGYSLLTGENLPEPDVRDSSSQFDVVLDTGANIKTAAEAVFGSGLYWIKDRDSINNHQLIDYVRGTSAVLQSNTTAAETTYSAPSGNSVAWCWKEGVIPGFDIVTYNGTGVAQNISHNLGVAPELMLVKNRDAAWSWAAYHKEIGGTGAVFLNLTNPETTSSIYWDDTVASVSTFRVGTDGTVNTNTEDYVAYLFASIPGFSKVFSYTGNGSTDGPFIPMDFQPAFVMIKRINAASEWIVKDTQRESNGGNPNGNTLFPNLSAAESSPSHNPIDVISNGFKCRSTSTDTNASGGTYIGIAFAEHPFKYSRAR